jgi:D-alanyl-lipoteichoic acid acyltransferase DltB (MBOAT superfamily)
VGFAITAFAVVKLPISRSIAAGLITALSFVALTFLAPMTGGAAFAGMVSFQATLLPMLWYSVYEEAGSRGPLRLRRFLLYLSARFFGGPAVTYPDLFSLPRERLDETRLAGVRAIYIALIAAITTAAAGWVDRTYPNEALKGFPLLAASYVGYVGAYCKIVVAFNLVIGVLRVFGIPVRNNFDYWLLAATPNEHWKRWNILFREWLVTFVFFPIMRAKRWLFVAVMAALMTSALLHIVPVVIYGEPSWAYIVANTLYYFLNGLAIYVVLIVPQRWPWIVSTLRIRENRVWLIIGVVLTSAFYAVLHGIRASAEEGASVLHYLARLTTLV